MGDANARAMSPAASAGGAQTTMRSRWRPVPLRKTSAKPSSVTTRKVRSKVSTTASELVANAPTSSARAAALRGGAPVRTASDMIATTGMQSCPTTRPR